jgi:hypothetical protein
MDIKVALDLMDESLQQLNILQTSTTDHLRTLLHVPP